MSGPRAKIAIIEDDHLLRQQIAWSLKGDYQILEAGSREEAVRLLRTEAPDLVLLDMHLPPTGRMEEGLRLIRETRHTGCDSVFIMMSGSDKPESAQRAIGEGAYDFFRKPFDLGELRLIIQRALDRLRIERENRRLRFELQSRYAFHNIVGHSPAMRRVWPIPCPASRYHSPAGVMPACAHSFFSSLCVPDSSPRETNVALASAIVLKASIAFTVPFT